MNTQEKFKVTMSGFNKKSNSQATYKTIEFDSLAPAEQFFWNILKTDFLKDAVLHMIIYQGDELSKKNWIMNFSGFQYVSVNKPWLKKPYDKEKLEINDNGKIVKSSAWTKSEYEWAIEQAKNDLETKSELIKNMNNKYSQLSKSR